ncbi:DUF4190 domain-containing protein [Streptomyces sp. NPDC059398]|uniref:DUF4190 domain-containing protein n=1 Tax=Streptomyces sp. NPDC059398 TaxID=3346820 RepID=UPI0036B08EA0
MSDNAPHPSGDPEPPSDPWAPPGRKVPLDKQPGGQADRPRTPGAVHDQQTVTAVPAAGTGQPGPVPADPGQQTPGPHIPGQQGPAQDGAGQHSVGQHNAAQHNAAQHSSGVPGPGAGPHGSVPPGFAPPGYPPPGAVPPPPIGPNGPGPQGSGPGAPGTYGYPSYPGAAPGPQGNAAYGYPGYGGGQGGWNTLQPAPANGFGVAALVLGILSVVIFCAWGLGVILGTLALIFGILGRKRANRGQANNGGMALAGIILGPIGIVFSLIFLSLMIWGLAHTHHSTPDYGTDDGDTYPSSLIVGAGH